MAEPHRERPGDHSRSSTSRGGSPVGSNRARSPGRRGGRRRPWIALAAVNLGVGLALVALILRLSGAPAGTPPRAADAVATVSRVDAFDARRAWSHLKWQAALGERPAGSPAARRLARWARARLPRGRYEPVPGGLINVVGTLPGRKPAILVGAHYDTKALPGFVGANDGASGVAAVLELARVMRALPRPAGAPELRFALFDGEESPDDRSDFYASGLRGSRAYAARHADELRGVVVLDMIGDRRLSIPREESSDPRLWGRLRQAAARAGTATHFPAATRTTILDDHTPFLRAGIPAVDVIDFDFDCWHRICDDLSAVSPRSLDVVGETMVETLRAWR